jgi:hypothetical protein
MRKVGAKTFFGVVILVGWLVLNIVGGYRLIDRESDLLYVVFTLICFNALIYWVLVNGYNEYAYDKDRLIITNFLKPFFRKEYSFRDVGAVNLFHAKDGYYVEILLLDSTTKRYSAININDAKLIEMVSEINNLIKTK